ncbi:flagellar assembly protein FliW [Candidatus Formimonas warabiya]|uniref:Flagellar assembly factor FliW n=1 Tax=Formimonas warabiya TaxID=1761012 RepID=A0A3G1KT88_FORW1|nr:flagellar assembly protein FliW [Candidatus Formimonas warabiya]ATW25692.1 hypothetical protein DCMF_13790 [Candidatus Formimonas warabiya]
MSELPVKVTFPKGILGFEQVDGYILDSDEQGILFSIRGEKNTDVAFLAINPFIFFPDYSFDLEDFAAESIGLMDISDAWIFTLLTMSKDISRATANLLGPLVINKKNHQGIQVVLNDSRYTTKHAVFADHPLKGGND